MTNLPSAICPEGGACYHTCSTKCYRGSNSPPVPATPAQVEAAIAVEELKTIDKINITKQDYANSYEAVADTRVGFHNSEASVKAWDRLALVFAKARMFDEVKAGK